MITLPPDVILVLAKYVVGGGVDRKYVVEDDEEVYPLLLVAGGLDVDVVIGLVEEVGVWVREVGAGCVVRQECAKSV